MTRFLLAVVFITGATSPAPAQKKLAPKTLAAFNEFVARAEESMAQRGDGGTPFLWLGEDTHRLNDAVDGDLIIERLADDAQLDDGMIHNWIGGMFVPDVTIDDILAVFLDYPRYPEIYPGVIVSQLVETTGEMNTIYQRLRRNDLVLDTWHEAGYRKLDRGRAVTWSRSTEIRELRNAGQPDEVLLPDGEGGGFLWRLHVYWHLEEHADGLFAECHSISLSRDIPFLLRWIVAPFVRRIPRQGLEQSLEATRVEARRVAERRLERGVD